jgi:hypothetical protein
MRLALPRFLFLQSLIFAAHSDKAMGQNIGWKTC